MVALELAPEPKPEPSVTSLMKRKEKLNILKIAYYKLKATQKYALC